MTAGMQQPMISAEALTCRQCTKGHWGAHTVEAMADTESLMLPTTLPTKPVTLPTRPALLPGGGAYADDASEGRNDRLQFVDTVTGMLLGSNCKPGAAEKQVDQSSFSLSKLCGAGRSHAAQVPGREPLWCCLSKLPEQRSKQHMLSP